MEAIFKGKKELFTDLWIGQKSSYSWPVHPVIHIDMNDVDKSDAIRLEGSLCRLMDRLAFEHGVEIRFAESSSEKFLGLVHALAPRGKVVVLIDEYDQPINTRFPDMVAAAASREVLREIYGKIKSMD
jgi:hypothetical protein